MAKVKRVSTNGLSTARPVLTGDTRVDQALWILSSILADIANQPLTDIGQPESGSKSKKEEKHGKNY